MTGGERWDPYIILGVSRQASGEEIVRAYRRAARASHPDSGGAGSAERFRGVSDAYELLRDPRRRAVYDRSHPLATARSDAERGSVRYAAPGSPHVVLGRQSRSAAGHPQPWGADFDEARFVRHRGDITEIIRVALWFLRAGR